MIQKNMVFEYQIENYIKYFIPKKLIDSKWYGLELDKEFNITGNDYWYEKDLNNSDLLKPAEKTLDTAYIGDILVVGDNPYRYDVLSRVGNLFKISGGNVFTLQELKDNGFTVYQEEEVKEQKEYSMDEVAKALGIKVEDLKIKKN